MAYNWKTSSQFWIQMLDLNDIMVFARVVEAGSFTAAARLLGMPKTTVSRRIAARGNESGAVGHDPHFGSGRLWRSFPDQRGVRFSCSLSENQGRVAPHGRHEQFGREPDRTRFPHRASSGLETERSQARLHA